MKLNFTTLDVFTSTRYQGNPLAIIRVPSTLTLTQIQKQTIAKEFNLSEIVFLHLPSPSDPSSASRSIDIFTAQAEVPFAGHPTIGTSFYLLKTGNEGSDASIAEVVTKAGRIPISLFGEEKVKALIPQNFHTHEKVFESELTPGEFRHPLCSIVKGMTFIYVPLPDLETLGKVDIRQGNLAGDTYNSSSFMDENWREGLVGTMYYVSVSGGDGKERHYRTRMVGSREDPGTGSASSGLACLLAKEFVGMRDGSESFVFEQGVEMGRMNEITVQVAVKAGEIENVWLSGEAAVVMEGTIEV